MRAVRNAWYCAALSAELSESRVLGRRILDQPLALFRDARGEARAVSAICPHRGADLARGSVVDGVLACPMHGWRFDSRGACVRVPSQPEALRISPQACVPSYEIRESQGIVWIWMGASAPGLEPPQYEAWEQSERQRRMFDRPRLWSCSFVNAVENAIDIAHAPFVHKQTLGTDQPLLLPRQNIRFDSDQRGFTGEDDPDSPWKAERPGGIPGGFAGMLARAIGVGNIAKQYYRFDLGGSIHFYIEYESGTFDVLFGHATPADETHTWFFGGTTRTRALHAMGDAVQRYFMRGLSDEDEAEVSTMWSNDERLLPKMVSAPADEGTLAFRKIWERALEQESVDATKPRATSAMTSARDNT